MPCHIVPSFPLQPSSPWASRVFSTDAADAGCGKGLEVLHDCREVELVACAEQARHAVTTLSWAMRQNSVPRQPIAVIPAGRLFAKPPRIW